MSWVKFFRSIRDLICFDEHENKVIYPPPPQGVGVGKNDATAPLTAKREREKKQPLKSIVEKFTPVRRLHAVSAHEDCKNMMALTLAQVLAGWRGAERALCRGNGCKGNFCLRAAAPRRQGRCRGHFAVVVEIENAFPAFPPLVFTMQCCMTGRLCKNFTSHKN